MGEKRNFQTASNEIVSLLQPALQQIINKPEPKPHEIFSKSPEAIRRKRDLDSLEAVFSSLYLPAIDEFLSNLPRKLDLRTEFYRLSFGSVVCGSLFSLYDQEALELIADINWQWGICLSFPMHYREGVNIEIQYFSNPGDAPLNSKQQEAWDTIEAAKSSFRNSLTRLLEIVREGYIEIDLIKTSRDARNAYIQHEEEMSKLFS
jgi:hypothetical protein